MQRATLTGILAGAAALAAFVVPRLHLAPPGATRSSVALHSPDPALPSGALQLRAGLDRGLVLRGQGSDRYLVLEVVAPDAARGERVPVQVSLIYDTSGSMASGGRMEDARRAALEVASRLRPQDALSLVTFSDQAWVRIPRTQARDPELFRGALLGLTTGGGTNLYDGLARGFGELDGGGFDGVRRAILLSDGEANVGDVDPEDMVRMVSGYTARGISLSALGVGLDFNEDLLGRLADAGGGTWRFADREGALPELLSGELERMTHLVGSELTLDVRLGDGVALEELYGWSSTSRADGFQVFLGDMHAGEHRKLVARVHISQDVPVLAEARLRYHDLDTGAAEARASVQGRYTEDVGAAEASRDEDLAEQVGQALAGAALEQSAKDWSNGDAQGARDRITAAKAAISEVQAAPAEAPALTTWMDAIEGGASEDELRADVKRAKETARGIAR